MSDLPETESDTDDVATDADGGTVELALRLIPPEVWQHHYTLMKVMADPKTAKRVLRSVHDSLVAAAQRHAELDAREAAVAARETAAAEHEKANTAKALKLHEQEVELATRKDARLDAVIERERNIGELERRWAFIGEDDQVTSGFRASQFGALYKARIAFGYASDAIAGLDDIAKEMAEKFPRGSPVRTGNVGESFPPGVTLTRDLPPPEPTAGARVRGRRGAAHV